MGITKVEVYARITVGGITADTPYIQSFSVNRTRGQAATFQASLKVKASAVTSAITGGIVRIYAGEGAGGLANAIFSGIAKKASISPCWDDAGYVLLSLSGSDVLSRLEGKKFTRRCRQINSKWASITGIHQPAYKDAKFKYDFKEKLTVAPADMDTRNEVVATRPSSILNVQTNVANTDRSIGGPTIDAEIISPEGSL